MTAKYSVSVAQLKALLPSVIAGQSNFTVGECIKDYGCGSSFIVNLKDYEDFAIWVREEKYGGTAVEAGYGPIRFSNTVKSLSDAIAFGMRQNAAKNEDPDGCPNYVHSSIALPPSNSATCNSVSCAELPSMEVKLCTGDKVGEEN